MTEPGSTAHSPDVVAPTARTVCLTRSSPGSPAIEIGTSPRASLALDKCGRTHAWLQGRDYVVPEDVRAIAADARGDAVAYGEHQALAARAVREDARGLSFEVTLGGHALGAVEVWKPLGLGFGLVSMIWGAFGALRHRDAKLILAWGTVSQLGLLIEEIRAERRLLERLLEERTAPPAGESGAAASSATPRD